LLSFLSIRHVITNHKAGKSARFVCHSATSYANSI
jgi:hypothetical protein